VTILQSDRQAATSRVQALDLLRLVAVIGVVLYHYSFRGPSVGGIAQVAIPAVAPLGMYGFLGVPAFFVISGFVIAYSATGRTAAGFAIARFSRIYPTFVLCMTLTFLTLVVFGSPHFDTSLHQWVANLIIAAPALHAPYMDSAYWSLVIEVTFYAWIAALMAIGLFPRRIDAIVLAWLCISVANELTIDATFLEKVFLADDSGYFATGLMIHELYRGRRDAMLFFILAASIATAVFHSIHSLAWLHTHAAVVFDPAIVSAICLGSIALIILATRIRNLPLPPGLVAAAGGMTYPLYLLHQQAGYTILRWITPAHTALLCTVILFGIAVLAWAIWRYVERPLQRATRDFLTMCAARLGWSAKPKAAVGH
jgi:peptidoglycan/LPS O-acetylase OafA/YrhL